MSERFYLAEPLAPGPLSIVGAEAHHIAQVLRLKPGAEIVLFNGDGHDYPTTLDIVKKSQVEATVTAALAINREAKRAVTIACPLPKGDRAMFLMEKLTELGVSRYLPLRTERSVVHPGDGKMDKLQRYVIEASKQCGRNVLMTIDPLVDWASLAEEPLPGTLKWQADATGQPATLPGSSSAPIIIALGPEGGWTAHERALGEQHYWFPITLGKSILRIETAALAASVLAMV